MLNGGCNWGNRSELLGVLMRWSLQLLPYQLWPNTTRGSKIFVSDAEYRCPVVPGRTFRYFRNVIPAIPACPVRPPRANIRPMPAFMSTRPSTTLADFERHGIPKSVFL